MGWYTTGTSPAEVWPMVRRESPRRQVRRTQGAGGSSRCTRREQLTSGSNGWFDPSPLGGWIDTNRADGTNTNVYMTQGV